MFISVIIPTFNRAGPVCRAIDSVLNQSYRDFELIVVDDGSTDRTETWVRAYADNRLHFVRREHRGVAAARNFGVACAQAEWICFLDSDDVWRQHKLREQVAFHREHRDCLLSQTDDIWVRGGRRVNKMAKHAVRAGAIFQDSLRRCLICCSSVMVKKSLFLAVGGFDESLPTCEDYDLWLKLSAHHQVGFIKQALVTKFGGHGDQLSKKYPMMDKYRLMSLKKLLAKEDLPEHLKRLVEEEIVYKKTIMEKGLNRHGNCDRGLTQSPQTA